MFCFWGKGTEIHEIHEIPPYKIDRIFFVRGSFRANKGSKRSYAITAFQKNRGYQKIFIFEKVVMENVTLANLEIPEFPRISKDFHTFSCFELLQMYFELVQGGFFLVKKFCAIFSLYLKSFL